MKPIKVAVIGSASRRIDITARLLAYYSPKSPRSNLPTQWTYWMGRL